MANPSSDPAAEPSTAVTATAQNGSSPKMGAVHPNRRRIIKAAPPKTPEAGAGGSETSMTGAYAYAKDDDLEDEKKKKHHGHNHHVDGEEDDKTKRLKTIEKRGKALREKELQERRKSGPAASNETADASANPFSRFKSIFSVEPQFPEHKRSLVEVNNSSGSSGTKEKDGGEPEEKRLKPSDDDDNNDDEQPTSSENGGTGGLESLFSSKAFWTTAAVAVVVGVALVLQRGRKK